MITVVQRARELGYSFAGHNDKHLHEKALRLVYEAETGRNAQPKFTEGVGRAQWEYGLRGTDYWTKTARERVLLMSEVKT